MSEGDCAKKAMDELLTVLSSCIFCEPLELQDRIIIPVMRLSLAIGAAGNGPFDAGVPVGGKSLQSGCGVGGGVGISPAGAVVIHDDIAGQQGVEFLPLGSILRSGL